MRNNTASKFTALPSDLKLSDLGLGQEAYNAICSTVTLVIHSAWAVNFTLGVTSFEAQHIAGLYHLLNLCLSVPFSHPARLAFISSVSVAAGMSGPARIPETLVKNPSDAQYTGYAQSKWVAEHIVHRATSSTGMEACVLRLGQIVGDTSMGHWNPSDAMPLMFRAAMAIGALPALRESVRWLPVDICAQAVIQLSGLAVKSPHRTVGSFLLRDPSQVFHVLNPVAVSWIDGVLPALAKAGLQFETVDQRKWVQLLRDGEQDPKLNPTVQLLSFYSDKYDKPGPGELIFETCETSKNSEAVKYGYDIIAHALLEKCVECWKKDWDR